MIDGAGRDGQRGVLGKGWEVDGSSESGSHLWTLHLHPHVGMCIHIPIDI